MSDDLRVLLLSVYWWIDRRVLLRSKSMSCCRFHDLVDKKTNPVSENGMGDDQSIWMMKIQEQDKVLRIFITSDLIL
jgi:hypothetical protein